MYSAAVKMSGRAGSPCVSPPPLSARHRQADPGPEASHPPWGPEVIPIPTNGASGSLALQEWAVTRRGGWRGSHGPLSSKFHAGGPLSPSGPLHCLTLTEAARASLAFEGVNNRACFDLDSRDVSFFSQQGTIFTITLSVF